MQTAETPMVRAEYFLVTPKDFKPQEGSEVQRFCLLCYEFTKILVARVKIVKTSEILRKKVLHTTKELVVGNTLLQTA